MAWVTYKTGRREHLPRVRGDFHETDKGDWCISLSGFWLPGIFDTLETAKKAIYLPEKMRSELNRRICHFKKEDRAITMADINATKKAKVK